MACRKSALIKSRLDRGKAMFTIDCTGDACIGDKIEFTESVFGGSFKKPKFLGQRIIQAEIINESYGAAKQQHTFSLLVIGSSGYEPIEAGFKIKRKGRNIYRNGTKRALWHDEKARLDVLEEKHGRGNIARANRATRKEETILCIR